MIEATEDMIVAAIGALRDTVLDGEVDAARAITEAILGIVERDYTTSRRPTPEEEAQQAERLAAHQPARRLKSCIEQWPECETGDYDPRCCRFPKSCSASVYRDGTSDELLEPPWSITSPNPSEAREGR